MKFFLAALPFLILATALGSRVQVLHEPMVAKLRHEPLTHMEAGFLRPSDCCPDYKRKIRCANMKDFFETSSGCSRPGVIFLTKKERLVCANPLDLEVQNCMRSLRKNLIMQMLLEKKEY
ncbi:C-C motif chemokine 23-like isoform X1 [Mirounga angustirostris]|uniref:C-C motif chemokine 15-like isoform X1 n=1 Tax=Mirounga leonina TaxID=9715 RepID=UPI00156BE701|nr:C-C motif chemokine 15-like isoform X1 [Mirounga leonina]XP_045745318.1 C-C motif chemokine 23-like isoform X1 [Mirounga angustirostris]